MSATGTSAGLKFTWKESTLRTRGVSWLRSKISPRLAGMATERCENVVASWVNLPVFTTCMRKSWPR